MKRPMLMAVAGPVSEDFEALEKRVSALAEGGVDAVLLRDKTAQPDRVLEAARRLRRATQGKALLIVHTDARAARESGADGLHLSASEMGPLWEARARLSPGAQIGFSVHSVEEAKKAAAQGADYLLAGTIFPSASHPGLAPAGTGLLESVCSSVFAPVLAIGGVTPENAAECLRAGAAGVAVLSPFMRADDPGAAARAYRKVLDGAEAILLTVNGRTAAIPKPLTIAEFLASRNLPSSLVAVERNRMVVPRSLYARVTLSAGDALEIVQAVAGG